MKKFGGGQKKVKLKIKLKNFRVFKIF